MWRVSQMVRVQESGGFRQDYELNILWIVIILDETLFQLVDYLPRSTMSTSQNKLDILLRLALEYIARYCIWTL